MMSNGLDSKWKSGLQLFLKCSMKKIRLISVVWGTTNTAAIRFVSHEILWEYLDLWSHLWWEYQRSRRRFCTDSPRHKICQSCWPVSSLGTSSKGQPQQSAEFIKRLFLNETCQSITVVDQWCHQCWPVVFSQRNQHENSFLSFSFIYLQDYPIKSLHWK